MALEDASIIDLERRSFPKVHRVVKKIGIGDELVADDSPPDGSTDLIFWLLREYDRASGGQQQCRNVSERDGLA